MPNMEAVRVKPKRKNSELRKEKSRNAARCRRSNEAEIFSDLIHQLPVSYPLLTQLDKASIIRLTIAHIKLRTLFANGSLKRYCDGMGDEIDPLLLKLLDGFVLLVDQHSGSILYISENVDKLIGITQIEFLGNSLFDFVHPGDHDDLRSLINHKSQGEFEQNGVLVRMNSALSSKGRSLNSKAFEFKVMSVCTSSTPKNISILDDEEEDNSPLVLIFRPIVDFVHCELALDQNTFVSRLSLNLRFTHCDKIIQDLLGYDADDLIGEPLYKFHHALDDAKLEESYRSLLVKGQSMTGLYRFLAKGGGYVWMDTQSTIIGDVHPEKSQSVLNVNHVISSEIECQHQIFAAVQLPNHPDHTDSAEIIEEDPEDGFIVEDRAELDNTSFVENEMLLVTEKLVDETILPSPMYSGDSDVIEVDLSEDSPQQLFTVDETTKMGDLPILCDIVQDLTQGVKLRAPFIPMTDTSFRRSFSAEDEDVPIVSSSLDLKPCPMITGSEVDLQVLNSLFTADYNGDDVQACVIGSTSEDASLAGWISIASEEEVQCVGGCCDKGEAAISLAPLRAKPEPGSSSGSSVLLNLLTKGVDYNNGYRLKTLGPNKAAGESSAAAAPLPDPRVRTIYVQRLSNPSAPLSYLVV